MEVKQCHAVLSFKFPGFRKIDLHVQESDSLFGVGECVLDGGADCIHECDQGVKLEVEAQENEEDVIVKRFQKQIRWKKLGLWCVLLFP